MQLVFTSALTAAIFAAALPAKAAQNSVWNTKAGPTLPYRYIDSVPVLLTAPQFANAETYASEALFQQLYPSIKMGTTPDAETIGSSIASNTRDFGPFQTRGILSSSYVQEFAYIDTCSNIRKYEEYFSFPSIRMSLAMPPYGNGFGGGYPPLQFGFGPAAFGFW